MTERSLRAWAFRMRGGLWTGLFLVLLALAKPTGPSLAMGLALVVLGQLLRFWAAGSIGLYRGEEVKAERLVSWGPYGWIRNPLYLANGLMGLGWALSAGWQGVALFLGSFLVIYPLLIIPHEEAFLEERFGEAFRTFRATTPMLFPSQIPVAERRRGPFDETVLWRSERHSLWITLAATALLVSRLWW